MERDKGIDQGCTACCARRALIAMVDATPQPEGTVVHPVDVPEPCERCGVVPESVIEIAEVVVESRAAG